LQERGHFYLALTAAVWLNQKLMGRWLRWTVTYQTGAGGGATIMDKFGDTDFETEELGQRHSTVA